MLYIPLSDEDDSYDETSWDREDEYRSLDFDEHYTRQEEPDFEDLVGPALDDLLEEEELYDELDTPERNWTQEAILSLEEALEGRALISAIEEDEEIA